MADENFFPVSFGTRTVQFFPLAVGWLRVNGAIITKLRDGAGDIDAAMAGGEKMGVLIDILHASALRGNPAVTKDDVEAVIDLQNVFRVMDFVLGKSGFRRVSIEGAADPMSPQIGGESTPQ